MASGNTDFQAGKSFKFAADGNLAYFLPAGGLNRFCVPLPPALAILSPTVYPVRAHFQLSKEEIDSIRPKADVDPKVEPNFWGQGGS